MCSPPPIYPFVICSKSCFFLVGVVGALVIYLFVSLLAFIAVLSFISFAHLFILFSFGGLVFLSIALGGCWWLFLFLLGRYLIVLVVKLSSLRLGLSVFIVFAKDFGMVVLGD